ncbi:CDP-glucose 4,6-dehydratase [Acetobacterium tundrae]|uniref:CDP-glucose 4,6-dehydratase n=1 Tax=Acetobacterium tundrae TaxID=132932 RepID=A0ABR6WKL1_9FIRM|nr:CDP-glucose 4,6-dehydratase [Acetobacterium tundrae]MBC3797057.1 CDP-glucose 4,6-dehydratase [Acetobacterium tundrae]
MVVDINYYKGKRVFITGHTGFKGSWLSKILINAGAEVTGYSLEQKKELNLFTIAGIEKGINSIVGDVRNLEYLQKMINETKPEFVFHLAAQPIVSDSYKEPVYTYETNVMGTVNILEAIRHCESVRSFLNVTTDKVYENKEWCWGYRENDRLSGFDPYSNSKSCSELVTQSYKQSFFGDTRVAISTARAGNVIGGGDFAKDRIIPDCVRAIMREESIVVRNPYSIRPYQHVLEPLFVYLLIAKKQQDNAKYAGCYNVGPDEQDWITTGELVSLFCENWDNGLCWEKHFKGGPHEANFLKLDCSKLKNTFGWKPHWNIKTAVKKTIEWTKCFLDNNDVDECMDRQIDEYFYLNKN